MHVRVKLPQGGGGGEGACAGPRVEERGEGEGDVGRVGGGEEVGDELGGVVVSGEAADPGVVFVEEGGALKERERERGWALVSWLVDWFVV